MQKFILGTGAICAALAVILGAFGAHALRTRLGPEQLQVFETGVRYQFYHSFALLLLAIIVERYRISTLELSAWGFGLGILFFSGSLYLLSCRELLGITGWRWLGPLTPFGGLCFITGWLSLFAGILKGKPL